jgi:hypothetical protein
MNNTGIYINIKDKSKLLDPYCTHNELKHKQEEKKR